MADLYEVLADYRCVACRADRDVDPDTRPCRDCKHKRMAGSYGLVEMLRRSGYEIRAVRPLSNPQQGE